MVANPDVDAILVSTPEHLHSPDDQGRAGGRQARPAGEAHRPHARRGRRADRPLRQSRPQADDRLLAALQRQAVHGQALRRGGRARRDQQHPGQPPHHPLARRQDQHRTKLSPAAMEATHDLDFAFWCLEPRRPVRVYSQNAWGVRADTLGVPDTQYVVVTMDDGAVVAIGAGMSLPPGYPNQSTTWIEVLGTEGAAIVDASHRDVVVNTVEKGVQFPLSTMPGEYVDHMYAGPMERETTHFLEAVAYDRPVMVDPDHARTVTWRSTSPPTCPPRPRGRHTAAHARPGRTRALRPTSTARSAADLVRSPGQRSGTAAAPLPPQHQPRLGLAQRHALEERERVDGPHVERVVGAQQDMVRAVHRPPAWRTIAGSKTLVSKCRSPAWLHPLFVDVSALRRPGCVIGARDVERQIAPAVHHHHREVGVPRPRRRPGSSSSRPASRRAACTSR